MHTAIHPANDSRTAWSARRQRQHGVAMLLVLAAVAGVFVIGMAMASSVPAMVRASANQADRDAAMYLADSALAEALHHVKDPPPGDAWMTTQRHVEGMNGGYEYTVAENSDSSYTLTALGRYGTGTDEMTYRRVLRVAFTRDVNTYTMHSAAELNGGSAIAAGMRFDGDVHFNGTAVNLGVINGDLRATGRVLIAGRVNGDVYRNVTEKPAPRINLDAYQTYAHNGRPYRAETLTAEDLAEKRGKFEPASTTNPLGIVMVDGDLTLEDDLRMANGILVVRGDLNANGHRLRLDGQADHMTLLVEDDLQYNRSRSEVQVRKGTAFIGGDIQYGGGLRHELDFRDGMILTGNSPLLFPGDFRVRSNHLEEGTGQVRYFGEQQAGRGAITITDLQFIDD